MKSPIEDAYDRGRQSAYNDCIMIVENHSNGDIITNCILITIVEAIRAAKGRERAAEILQENVNSYGYHLGCEETFVAICKEVER